MPTVMNHHHTTHHREVVYRTVPQKVCIGIGIGFLVIGLAGIMMPGFMQMHLSMAHNLIHLASGAMALWAGYSAYANRAYVFSVAFGVIYGLLGLAGFVIGRPGYPSVGHMGADQNLFRVIPNVLEFGSNDHLIHILISGVFLATAFIWKRVNDQRRTGISNFGSTSNTASSNNERMTVKTTADVNRRTTLGNSDKVERL